MRLLISREEAIKRHLPRYFTGKPCRSGHVCERFTVNWDCVSCVSIRKKRLYRTNKEYRKKAIESQRAFRRDHPKEMKKRKRIEYLRHTEAYRTRNANKRAKKRGCVGEIFATDIKRQLSVQGFKCNSCGIDLSDKYYAIDHIIALWRNGPNRPENLQCLCRPCHLIKSAKDSSDFFAERRRKSA